MKLKESVLKGLEERRGEYLSGELLARELGVTRQSVGKAVCALKAEGYPVCALPRRGYKLPAGYDVLSARQIGGQTGLRVLLYESLPSTNAAAAEQYLKGGACIVVARAQTAGRKKDGGVFFSPKDGGIYASYALPLDLPLTALPALRRACGEAVARVISDSCGKPAECRRLDEIYIGGKKVAGILVECGVNAATRRTQSAVIGVGVYTAQPFGEGELASALCDRTRNFMISEIYLRLTAALSAL